MVDFPLRKGPSGPATSGTGGGIEPPAGQIGGTTEFPTIVGLTDENGEYMPLTLMIEDVESGTAHGSSVAVVHAVLGTHLYASI